MHLKYINKTKMFIPKMFKMLFSNHMYQMWYKKKIKKIKNLNFLKKRHCGEFMNVRKNGIILL